MTARKATAKANSVQVLANVDNGEVVGVLDGATEDLVGERGGIAFAEEDEAEGVGDRVAILPLEVGVGDVAGSLFKFYQEGGDGVRDDWAAGLEDLVVAEALTVDDEGAVELGGVAFFDLEEVDGLGGAQTIALADGALDAIKVGGGFILRSAGDDADNLILVFREHVESIFGEIDGHDAEFGGTHGSRKRATRRSWWR